MRWQVVNTIEESAIGSFLELVVKLNEVTFKPLFIRLYDWAVIDLSEGAGESTHFTHTTGAYLAPAPDSARLIERKIVLLHVMMGLLQKFKVSQALALPQGGYAISPNRVASPVAVHRDSATSHRGAASRLRKWRDQGRGFVDAAA